MISKTLGIALSGGGVRATVFHAGLFRYLAEQKALEEVAHISTVSGGSLFAGLVFSIAGNKWPSSGEYVENVYPEIRRLLTQKSLQTQAISCLLFNPANWRYAFSRANIVAHVLERCWSIKGCLGELPAYPIWSVNATTAENGRRFRFKKTQMGDYEFGYASAPNIKIATAMAVSAAFPGGIGPLGLDTSKYQWEKRPWNSAESPKRIIPEFHRIHLYDGGVYDNLGLEPLFDVGTQRLKSEPEIKRLIVSDAGATLERASIPTALNPRRFKRLSDMALDQVRSLRVRALVNFVRFNPGRALYIQIGSSPLRSAELYGVTPEINTLLEKSEWLTSPEIRASSVYPTTLKRMLESDFDLISRHGYETGKWNDIIFKMTN